MKESSPVSSRPGASPLSDPFFWRAGALATTLVMLAVLIFLSIDSLDAVSTGGRDVPPYTVINHQIAYAQGPDGHTEIPEIGGQQLLFGKHFSPEQAQRIIREGKLVIQSRACMDCHTFFGDGAYYAPDLTKAWLDPAWRHVWKAMTQANSPEQAMTRFLMHPVRYANWYRRMPNLHLNRHEAQSVVAYLKWMSAIHTNGFPAKFPPTALHTPQGG